MSANDLSRLPDDDLMVLVANGVIEQPGDELCRRHGEVLFSFIVRQCKGDTRRASYYMEQVWIKLLTRCGDYTAHADFRAFLFETARQIIGTGEDAANAQNAQALEDVSTLPIDAVLATRIRELTLQVQAAQAPRRRALMQELAKGKRTTAALGSKVSGRTWFWLRTHRKIKEAEKARAAKRPWWQRFAWRNVGAAVAAFLAAALGTQWFFARQVKETPVQVAVPHSEASSPVGVLPPERSLRPERSRGTLGTQREPMTPLRDETPASGALSARSQSPSQNTSSLSARSALEGGSSALPAGGTTTETLVANAPSGTPSSSQSSSDPELPTGTDALLEEDPSRVLRALTLPRGKFKVIAHVAQPERPAVQTWLAHLQSTLPPDAPLEVTATDQLALHLVRIEIAPMP